MQRVAVCRSVLQCYVATPSCKFQLQLFSGFFLHPYFPFSSLLFSIVQVGSNVSCDTHTHAHTHPQTQTHTHTHSHTQTQTQTHTHTHIHTHTYTHTHTNTHTHTYAHTHTHIPFPMHTHTGRRQCQLSLAIRLAGGVLDMSCAADPSTPSLHDVKPRLDFLVAPTASVKRNLGY